MARTGPLGPTLKRLRGGRRIDRVAAAAGLSVEVLTSIEAGLYVPTTGGLRALCAALELNLVDVKKVEWARQETIGLLRANPWAAGQVRRAG